MKTSYKLNGSETITYFNNSPDQLTYLWLQLDENEHSSKNNANYQDGSTMPHRCNRQWSEQNGDGEKAIMVVVITITKITDALGKPLKYTINKTMMRVELPAVLKPGQQFVFKIDWNYKYYRSHEA